jgi:hypothetical protein
MVLPLIILNRINTKLTELEGVPVDFLSLTKIEQRGILNRVGVLLQNRGWTITRLDAADVLTTNWPLTQRIVGVRRMVVLITRSSADQVLAEQGGTPPGQNTYECTVTESRQAQIGVTQQITDGQPTTQVLDDMELVAAGFVVDAHSNGPLPVNVVRML